MWMRDAGFTSAKEERSGPASDAIIREVASPSARRRQPISSSPLASSITPRTLSHRASPPRTSARRDSVSRHSTSSPSFLQPPVSSLTRWWYQSQLLTPPFTWRRDGPGRKHARCSAVPNWLIRAFSFRARSLNGQAQQVPPRPSSATVPNAVCRGGQLRCEDGDAHPYATATSTRAPSRGRRQQIPPAWPAGTTATSLRPRHNAL